MLFIANSTYESESKTAYWFIVFCLVSMGCHSEVHVAITFFLLMLSFFYQLSHIIFFGVHTYYVCYLSKK